jgi:hypothetical protein
MKIQTQITRNQGADNNPSPQGNTTHRAGQHVNRGPDQRHVDELIGDYQQAISNENEAMDKTNQAKRLKLTTTASTNNKQPMTGLGFQASQLP